MSKPSRRPTREARKKGGAWKEERRQKYKELRRQQEEEGLGQPTKQSLPNRKSDFADEQAERQAREAGVIEQWRALRSQLPNLLRRLKKIPDPRNPATSKHKLTVLLLYGLFMFVFQVASRREANRILTQPQFLRNLQELFPELESMPHADTLYRLLRRIDVMQIEAALVELVARLIHDKKFKRWMLKKTGHVIAIDGTQKWFGELPWAGELQERTVKTKEGDRTQYYVYVLEATLVLSNGIRLPLLSEFLTYPDGSTDTQKQDCELKAFYRLTQRLKEYFPRLRITLLLDGIFPCGPVFELCRRYRWGFMIVLKDGSLKQVWDNASGVQKLTGAQGRLKQVFRGRHQRFWWANHLKYYYDANDSKMQVVHLVVCEEHWKELDPETNEPVTKTAKHAWVSSDPFEKNDVAVRCNGIARRRWDIETMIRDEKRRGYQYGHPFAYDWNAMRGFHYLMRLAHLLNTLAFNTIGLVDEVARWGIQSLIQWLRTTYSGPWLDYGRIRSLRKGVFQLRLA